MSTKKKAPRFTSPRGFFRYPALVKPDFGTKEFPKPNGEFKVQLVVKQDDPAVKDFLKKIQPLHDAAIEAGEEKFKGLKVEQRKKLKELKVNDLFQIEYDKETEEPTGNIIFKFVTTASGKNEKGEAWERKLPLFDAFGKPAKLKAVGGGSEGKVSFEASPYFIPGTGAAGLKMYLVAAQIIELRTFGGGSAGDFGFGEEDGGGFAAGSEQEDDDAPFDVDEKSADTPDEDEEF